MNEQDRALLWTRARLEFGVQRPRNLEELQELIHQSTLDAIPHDVRFWQNQPITIKNYPLIMNQIEQELDAYWSNHEQT